jgi:serine/threonine protein kinase/tetratricopeptide (TPR) repeat protein
MTPEHEEDRMDQTRSFDVIPPGTLVSQYKIIRLIGSGGMGDVYLAEDTKLQRKVALKFLISRYASDSDLKARFMREAQAAACLNHPNIITVHEVASYKGRPYMAMEFVDGASLRDLMAEEEMSTKEVVDIAMQIGEGLGRAHEEGVVHRDVKPQNILIGKSGRVKITDFGLAKLRGSSKITRAGSTFGTIAYMSPEQAQAMDVDQRADIFSFGVVLYQMLTRRLPFKGDNTAAIINSIINDVPEPVVRYKAGVPDGLQRIVEKALVKERDERYQHVDDLVADLRRERKRLEFVDTSAVYPRRTRRSWKKIISIAAPASIVAVAALLVFILEPFRVEVGPEQEALARENSLAIMHFENLVERDDPERLGEIVSNLLITDLSESHYVSVVSSQRLYDILKLVGEEDLKTMDRSVATETATKAGAEWMLLGSILQIEPRMILTSQLVEVETGTVTASQRITGAPGENIFSMVDRLTVEIKADLALPAQAIREDDRPVADVTTTSAEAYRYYLEGLDYQNKVYSDEALKSFGKALDFDSTFAMAYYWLALLKPGTGQKEMLEKAVRYSDGASARERHYIMALQAAQAGENEKAIAELDEIIKLHPDDKDAHFWLGNYYRGLFHDYEKAIVHISKAIELDPLYKTAYNMLAYAYNDIGEFEKSIWAINKYISLVPDEANPYDSRADLHAYNGNLDQAVDSYRRALQIKPDFYPSLVKLGHMYLFKREYAKAESCYKEVGSAAIQDWRSAGRLALAMVPLYQGKLKEGLRVLADGITADRMEQAEGVWNISKYTVKAFVHVERGEVGSALSAFETGMELQKKAFPNDWVEARDVYAYLLAKGGRIDEAEQVARTLKSDIEDKHAGEEFRYFAALGLVELARGNSEAAADHLARATSDPRYRSFVSRFLLARAYLGAGKLGEAVDTLEKVLSRYDEDRASNVIWAVRAHYLLGLAYEESGWNKKAIGKYEEFLEILEDADPDLADVEDARQRLARLRAQA